MQSLKVTLYLCLQYAKTSGDMFRDLVALFLSTLLVLHFASLNIWPHRSQSMLLIQKVKSIGHLIITLLILLIIVVIHIYLKYMYCNTSLICVPFWTLVAILSMQYPRLWHDWTCLQRIRRYNFQVHVVAYILKLSILAILSMLS